VSTVRDRDRDLAGRPMIRLLVSLALHLAGNAIALIIAAAVLDDMSLDWSAFLIAVAIFTAVEVLAEPLLTKIATLLAGLLIPVIFVKRMVQDDRGPTVRPAS
jgi:hypothetical protein